MRSGPAWGPGSQSDAPKPTGRGRGRGMVTNPNVQALFESKSSAPASNSPQLKSAVQKADSESSESDVEEREEDTLAAESTFRDYKALTRNGGGEEMPLDAGVVRTRDYIIETKKGHQVCLICLDQIGVEQATWQCSRYCFRLFHLVCMQSWVRNAPFKASILSPEAFPNRTEKPPWFCPNCRGSYQQEEAPSKYLCFCGKVDKPVVDRWLVPHSCGQTCAKELLPACGHLCKLLCHPGPCPPCPQTVQAKCHCGKTTSTQRCGRHHFSCSKPCLRLLNCGIHKCVKPCHEGECARCERKMSMVCSCGKTSADRPCGDQDFHCGQPCGKRLPCGRHSCDQTCHAGDCPPCALSGPRRCPCGKSGFKLPCDQPTPTCPDTCDKMLPCGKHRCAQRCHNGPCDTCRMIIWKKCRCGSSQKQVPCHQELLCDRKCINSRNCGRHACKRRCCQGECPPCDEVCGRKLNCGNHKCPATCHDGPCFPCPLTVTIACACGSSQVTVPCGREKSAAPPKCKKRCTNPPNCHHPSRKAHYCHFGPCKKCEQPCDLPLPSCEHRCPVPCHDPEPEQLPPNKRKRKKKPLGSSPDQREQSPLRPNGRADHADEVSAAQSDDENGAIVTVIRPPCPPCMEPVMRNCLGLHLTVAVPCSSPPFMCASPCNNLLECGNHRCSLACHTITQPRGQLLENLKCMGATLDQKAEDSCESCERRCERPRDPPCPHPCNLRCHPDPCRPCVKPIKLRCHCNLQKIVLSCIETHDPDPIKRESQLSCKGPCHKKLPYCSHLCSSICHSGPCPESNTCQKKVTVRCSCKRLKKECVCAEARSSLAKKKGPDLVLSSELLIGLIPCDETCQALTKQKQSKEPVAQAEPVEDSTASSRANSQKPAPKKKRTRTGNTDGPLQPGALRRFWNRFGVPALVALLMVAVTWAYLYMTVTVMTRSEIVDELSV